MNRNRPKYYASEPGQTRTVRDGRRQRRGLTLVKARKDNKGCRKGRRKEDNQLHLSQSNLHGDIVASVDVEEFGDPFVCEHPSDVTRVAFQNCEPQPQPKHAHKALG